MRRLWSGAVVVAFVAAMTAAAQAQIVNKKCPVKTGSNAKSSITTTYKGKKIGFC